MVKRVASNILLSNYTSTFLSVPKEQEIIWRKLLVESRPYSDNLKKLLIINAPNCLDATQTQYQDIINSFTIKDMRDKQYIRSVPKLSFGEHEQVRSYILLDFDDFLPTGNPQYRDHVISLSIICHLDYWEMEDYNLRPWAIAGYIDGILNESRLAGIGTLKFMGAGELIMNEYLGGVMLRYLATNGHDDQENEIAELPGFQDLS